MLKESKNSRLICVHYDLSMPAEMYVLEIWNCEVHFTDFQKNAPKSIMTRGNFKGMGKGCDIVATSLFPFFVTNEREVTRKKRGNKCYECHLTYDRPIDCMRLFPNYLSLKIFFDKTATQYVEIVKIQSVRLELILTLGPVFSFMQLSLFNWLHFWCFIECLYTEPRNNQYTCMAIY